MLLIDADLMLLVLSATTMRVNIVNGRRVGGDDERW